MNWACSEINYYQFVGKEKLIKNNSTTETLDYSRKDWKLKKKL